MTDNYIRMCEKAEEIQEECQFRLGDWFWFTGQYGLCIFEEKRKSMIEDSKDEGIWLPTQEQLQDMIVNYGHHGYDNGGILFGIMKFADENNLEKVSMNELWLAFVMKEKYNKSWNGERWVKIND